MPATSPSAATPVSPWIRWIRRVTLALLAMFWLAALGAVIWVRADERWGADVQMLATVGALAGGGLLSLIWFAALAPLRLGVRLGVAAVAIGLASVLAGLLRLEEVTGGMYPRFVMRWSAKADQRLEALPRQADDTVSAVDLATTGPDDYPCFLGPGGRQSVDGVQFDTNWSAVPPRCVWKRPIGAGWSAFAAVNGYAVTQEQRDAQELVSCYDIRTGVPIWASAIEARHETTMGGVGPRATPCIDEGRVYALGGTGMLRCLDGASGDELWRHDLLAEHGVTDDAQGVAWGRASSPLIVDDLLVVPVGGPANGPKSSLVAYDKRTGREVWRGGNHQVSYASPARARLLEQDQLIVVLENYVSGFAARSGDLLWEHRWPGSSTANANISNAVPLEPNRVFLSKGYGLGAELIEVTRDAAGQWSSRTIWKKPVIMKTKFSNVVVLDGYIYGLDDTILECIEIESGRKCWKSGRFGYGQLLRAGTTLIVLSETGELAAVEATRDKFLEHGRFAALEGKSWSHLCLYGRYLLVRNATEAACFELPNWQRNASPIADAKSSF